MSEDIPLAQSPRRLTGREPGPREPMAPEPHAWLRHHWLWEAFYGAGLAFAGHQIWTTGEPVTSRALASGLLGAIALWYVGFGRRLVLDHGQPWWRRAVFTTVMLGMLCAAAALVPASSIALIAVLPLTHQVLPARRVLPTTGVMLLALAAGLAPVAVRTGEVVLVLVTVAVVTALVLPNTVWINRIIWQSVERADLIGRLDASQAEVARLSHQAGVAAERQRLAGDIHDTIAQGLSSVAMLVQAADVELDRDPDQARKHLALVLDTVRENLAEARALVAALTPAALDGSPLPEALARLVARAGTRTTLAVTGTPQPLPTAVEVVLLRATQESLANVDKHASAGQASVELAYAPDAVVLAVTDDGCGIGDGAPAGGYGLAAMRTRAEQIGAAVTVESPPGAGTTVRVTVPA